MKESKIRPSEIYWMFFMISTILLIIGHYVRMIYLGEVEYTFIIFGSIMFVLGSLILFIKKIKDSYDYEK